ncbi:glycosyl hydrolase [Paenibacillaceae bacterium]|nr:glycosyl hydrolase [Paenibacillaceae bacterium]
MKGLYLVLAGSIFIAGCGENGSGKTSKNYDSQAEWATQMLLKNYWNEQGKFLNNAYPYVAELEEPLHYWWKAHGVDAMMDGYERSGDEAYLIKAEEIVKGIIKRNGSLFNEFYDDMEWLGLSALRLYDATESETVKNYVLKLWADIKTAWWEDELGGLAWKKDQRESRNACSNAPAAILAARLYERFGNTEDLEWAKKIYVWQKAHLVDPDSGLVYDGLELDDKGVINVNKDWIFTYNLGTYIGAGVELYNITQERSYLEDAEKTATAALDYHIRKENGLFKEDGTGDGGLFKGILIRYLVNLYKVTAQDDIKEMIYHNAEVLLAGSDAQETGLFGTVWDQPAKQPLDLAVQLSGVFLVEAAAKIAKLKQG